MIHAFQLDDDGEEELTALLNNPMKRIKHIKINCNPKTSVTMAVVDFVQAPEHSPKKRKRIIKRFHLLNGEDAELDFITQSTEFRVIHRYDFLTDNGVVVVLDYEDRRV